jgi:hypothetical protein
MILILTIYRRIMEKSIFSSTLRQFMCGKIILLSIILTYFCVFSPHAMILALNLKMINSATTYSYSFSMPLRHH